MKQGAGDAGAEIVIKVADRGPGIAPEHWDRVFERFYKVDPARTRQTGGTGLGLAITKHLVHAQGGRVWTEAGSESGQVFFVALPSAPNAAGAPAAEPPPGAREEAGSGAG